MSYLDTMAQGQQNAYGGYTQLHRRQPQTQMGGSQIRAPMRISLDRMYGGQPTALPGAPSPDQYNIPVPEETYQPTAGYTQFDPYLIGQDFEQYMDPMGIELWRPANPEPDQIYQAPGGTKLIWEDNEWKPYSQSRAAYTGTGTADIGEYLISQGFIGSTHWTYHAATNQGLSNLGEMYEYARTNMDETRNYGDWVKSMRTELQETIANAEASDVFLKGVDKEAYTQQLHDLADSFLSETQRMQDVTPTSENWQDQLTDLVEQLQAGDLDYLDENGNLDVTALREGGNVMGNWLADVLETSYETGVIQSDFWDEEGNLVPELEAMATDLTASPEFADDWNQYNKRLMMHAIGSGQSIESAYYTEATAGAIANYSTHVADQVTQVLTNEMRMQYEYIANSFKNFLAEASEDYDTENFAMEMANAYAAIQLQYQQELADLAAQVAAGESATMGSIFSGALSFIVNMALTFV